MYTRRQWNVLSWAQYTKETITPLRLIFDLSVSSLLFMDLSKAFDCLPHGLIIAKLHAHGVTTAVCELLFSYLHQRKQRVKISSRSDWTTLSKGVPQGSVWGPLLFNIFMNDLFLFIEKCNLYNYADGNSLDSSSGNLSEMLINLEVDGQNTIDWFMKNGMQSNPDKFHFMLLSPTPIENKCLIYIMAFVWSPKLLQSVRVFQ